MRRCCVAMVVALVALGASTAVADARERAPSQSASRSVENARAACPFCPFAAAAAVRAAIAIRTAAAARAALKAAQIAREQAAVFARASRARFRIAHTEARKVASRGKGWLKRNWGTLKHESKVCIATMAFMETHDYMKDRMLDRDEWSQYAIFGPRLVPPTETLAINFPVRFNAREIASKAYDEAIECAIGVGLNRWWSKKDMPYPR
jgi:hypothetical protein